MYSSVLVQQLARTHARELHQQAARASLARRLVTVRRSQRRVETAERQLRLARLALG